MNTENTSPTVENSQYTPDYEAPRSSSMAPKLLATLAVLILVGGAFFAGQMMGKDTSIITKSMPGVSNDSSTNIPGTTEVKTGMFAPVSEKGPQAYAAVDGKQLIWIPIDNPTAVNNSYPGQVFWGGNGSAGFGNSGITLAPDLKKLAVIDFVDKKLKIVSSDSSVVEPMPNLEVMYISGWSPDSNKVIVYVAPSTIADLVYPDGPGAEDPADSTHTISPTISAGGFYLINLENQSYQLLAALGHGGFQSWVDAKRIMVSTYSFEGGDENYVAYNIETGLVDPTKTFRVFDSYVFPAFSFSADGSKWVVRLHPRNTNGDIPAGKSILADFPNITGTTVKEMEFAQYQGEIISPDGSKVVFHGNDKVNDPWQVHLYMNGSEERLFPGLPDMWVDSNRFIYLVPYEPGSSNPGHTKYVKLYNATTKQSTDLYTVVTKGN